MSRSALLKKLRTYTNMTLETVDLKKLYVTAGGPGRRLPITDTAPGVQMVEASSIPLVK